MRQRPFCTKQKLACICPAPAHLPTGSAHSASSAGDCCAAMVAAPAPARTAGEKGGVALSLPVGLCGSRTRPAPSRGTARPRASCHGLPAALARLARRCAKVDGFSRPSPRAPGVHVHGLDGLPDAAALQVRTSTQLLGPGLYLSCGRGLSRLAVCPARCLANCAPPPPPPLFHDSGTQQQAWARKRI